MKNDRFTTPVIYVCVSNDFILQKDMSYIWKLNNLLPNWHETHDDQCLLWRLSQESVFSRAEFYSHTYGIQMLLSLLVQDPGYYG